MYKELTKKDWYKITGFPEDKKVDAIIVSGVALANREREVGFLEQALSNYKDVKKIEYIQDNFWFKGQKAVLKCKVCVDVIR